VAALFLAWGFAFTPAPVRAGETRGAPLIPAPLRATRRGTIGQAGRGDETYLLIGGPGPYLDRATDRTAPWSTQVRSKNRKMAAAKRFFQSAKEVTGGGPERVTTDGPSADPPAIRNVLGRNVAHRTHKYLNNVIEQDQRG
jgi:transposase-like protein